MRFADARRFVPLIVLFASLVALPSPSFAQDADPNNIVDPALLNPYGVIPVNPDKGNISSELADQFVAWITSVEAQEKIGDYGVDTFGQPLFYPDSEAWRSR